MDGEAVARRDLVPWPTLSLGGGGRGGLLGLFGLDSVTVFSLDLTVPSLEVLLLLELETSWLHPTSSSDKARAEVAAHITAKQFLIWYFIADRIGDG
jgi:hypothetical protein